MPVPALDHHATGYDLAHAYWLARAAALSCQGEDEIRATAEEWGFDRVRHYESRHRMPFLIEDTQGYTMAGKHMIVTAFRGTEPPQIRDWLTDVNTPPWPGPGGHGTIHFGFGQALDSVFPAVRDTITEFRDNDQSVWFTGHSLGGALAMLAGSRMYFEDPRLLADGIYTYGQPRTCDRLHAAAHNEAFIARTHRFVNNNDIVPRLPPEPVFHHVDKMHYIDVAGRIHDAVPPLGTLLDRGRGLTADPLAPGTDGVRDHHIVNYLEAIEKGLH
jgi:triacylglycerol lipase